MKTIATLSALIIILAACGQAPSMSQPTAAVTIGDIRQAPPGFTISFISIGAGIDAKALEMTQNILDGFKQKGAVRALTYRAWGLEGEVDVCVQFMDPSFSVDFMQAFHAQVGDNRLVTIQSAVGCPAGNDSDAANR